MVKNRLTIFLAGLTLWSLGSCSAPPAEKEAAAPASPTTAPSAIASSPSPSNSPSAPIPSPSSAATVSPPPTAAPSANPAAVPKPPVTVTIFLADNQCQKLIPKQVEVPAEQPIAGAVKEVLSQAKVKDVEIADSDVSVNFDKQAATIDLRPAPNSKRALGSLSACEQFVVFESLRETLTSKTNTKWNIKTVKFTERGKEIVF